MSLSIITTIIHKGIKGSRISKAISAEITRHLSARGSRNFPKAVTCPNLRAIHPSRRSVKEAIINITSAHILSCTFAIKIKYRKRGINIILNIVNAFGIFKGLSRYDKVLNKRFYADFMLNHLNKYKICLLKYLLPILSDNMINIRCFRIHLPCDNFICNLARQSECICFSINCCFKATCIPYF